MSELKTYEVLKRIGRPDRVYFPDETLEMKDEDGAKFYVSEGVLKPISKTKAAQAAKEESK